jgi:hypothetical protein
MQMLEKQQAKESGVRARVKALDDKASRAFLVMSTAVRVNAHSLEVRGQFVHRRGRMRE